MSERFDADERAAALELDQRVDDALAGRPPDTLLGRLVELHRSEPPQALAARVRSEVRRVTGRRWLAARVAAAVLAAPFLAQGVGSLLWGRWVASNLHVAFDSHVFFESGVLLLALGGVVLAGALRRQWLDLAVVAGASVGLVFGVGGASELREFPAGGLLHLGQGLAAAALVVLWWRARRYGFPPSAKKGHEE